MPSYTRSAAGQAAYETALRETRATWRSVEDHVRFQVLGWQRRKGVSGRWQAVRPSSGGWRRRALVVNPYPYEVPAGVEHWILWSEDAMTRGEVERYLERETPAWATGWSWVRNPPAARSVPDLWHVQVYFTKA
jgi:hypothetical protein